MKNKAELGEQWLVWICDYPRISSKKSLEILSEVVKTMGSKVISSSEIETKTENVACFLLSESHLIFHDYRTGEAVLDIFACGNVNIQKAFEYFQKHANFNNYRIINRLKVKYHKLTGKGDSHAL